MFSGEVAATPVALALGELTSSFDALLKQVEDGGLDHLDAHAMVTFLQEFESLRNRLSLVDHRTVRDCEDRRVSETFSFGRLTDFLASTLRISQTEASRRVAAMAAVGERVSMLGQPLEPSRPVLAAAQRRGAVSPEQVSIIQSALARVDLRGFDPAGIDAGEVLLTKNAELFGPQDLRILARRVVEAIDQDGSRPTEELNADRRHFRMRQNGDGSYAGEFRLTGAAGAKLQAVLGPLAAPRTTTVPGRDGAPRTQPDPRTHDQRKHDAVEEACDRLLRSGPLPDAGGTPASVIVHIDEDDLRNRTGFGLTSTGTPLSAAEVLRLAGEAEVLPAVFAASGALLSFGRSRRLATATQTKALIARDRGCSFPGCTTPPEWAERHHILAWVDGGSTDLINLTLLCGYHHRHFAAHGWTCRMNSYGLPEWIPPRWLDRQQRPLVNHRIRPPGGSTLFGAPPSSPAPDQAA